ncbi:MAG: endolytic transglycosylase MltG [Firmicutes bacterium]|nr:endolytic transglycosylase MltG [Bacillota bacterium]
MISKIKDLFYNINDIVVALLILAATALIIFTRVDLIMDYPAYASQKQEQQSTGIGKVDFSDVDLTRGEVDETLNSAPETLQTDPAEATEPADPQPEGSDSQQGSEAPAPTGEMIKVVIPSGATGSKIADILVECGLIDDRQVFLTTVTSMKKDTRLQSGTFEIPMGATPEEIVNRITR